MQCKRLIIIFLGLIFSLQIVGQEYPHLAMMAKYNQYRQRLENEFVLVSENVEHYGVNIPAVDRRTNKWGRDILSWSDGNSNFNNYIIFLVTEIELLKRNNMPYQHSLAQLYYAMLALERLDLYSEYNLRTRHNKQILWKGDSISSYIRYPADINGFMIRDDVSFGFWKNNYKRFGFEFGNPNENSTGTNRYKSIFQEGTIPMQGLSQDVIVHHLEAMAILEHFMSDEYVGNIPVNFINSMIPDYLKSKNILAGDSIYFDLWAKDMSLRLYSNLTQNDRQSAMVFKPWFTMGKIKPVELFSLLSTRWYIMNPVTEHPVREGSGEDFGILVNAHGFAETVQAISGRNDLHFEGSGHGFLRWLFKTVFYKEFKLPLGAAIAFPRNWDDNKTRSLAAFGNVHGTREPVFNALRNLGDPDEYRYYILTNYLLNKTELAQVYAPDKLTWTEDSTWFADVLMEAPPDGPFSDTTKPGYSIHWSTSSRIVWPTTAPTRKAEADYDFAGMDYLMLHNLYRLVFYDDDYFLWYEPVREKKSAENLQHQTSKQQNKMFYIHAPVTVGEKEHNIPERLKVSPDRLQKIDKIPRR
jgi:hypothetical protein